MVNHVQRRTGMQVWGWDDDTYACGTIVNDSYYWVVTGLPKGTSRSVGPGVRIGISGCWPFGCIAGGDSGAPVWYGSTLYGNLSTSDGAVSAAQYIQTDLNFHFCITYQCNY
jgi:hypothetical protein